MMPRDVVPVVNGVDAQPDDTLGKKNTIPADIVLVVKGAGVHKPDDTLDLFLKGFLPAVKSIDPHAEVRQNNDDEIFADFPKSPHTENPHEHLTEILLTVDNPDYEPQKGKKKTLKKRIWVKEIYWENELTPSSPWRAFFGEWQMASYAFRRDIAMGAIWLFSKIFKSKKNKRDSVSSAGLHFNFLLMSFAALYFLIGYFFISSFQEYYGFSLLETSFLGSLLPVDIKDGIGIPLLTILFVAFAATIMAFYPAFLTINHFNGVYGKIPSLQKWIMVLMAISFLLFTQEYFGIIAISIFPVLAMNLSRGLLWKRRPYINTDYPTHGVDLRTKSGSYKAVVSMPLVKFYYRFVIVLLLPILFFLVLLAKLFKWTKVLGTFGEGIELFLSTALGGILGDVSSYAMEPAQAYRVRSVVENEIRFFAQLEDKDVNAIHIFAHSQGTPITFETIFTQLPKAQKEKIKSYITIGSILSYYHQTAPILDSHYPPRRFRLGKYENDFADGFQWVNCWNLLDPITEFYGLVEYDMGDISPKNIKTRARFHSDYWVNVHEVHIPFLNHILGIHSNNDFWKKSQFEGVDEEERDPISHRKYDFITVGSFYLTLVLSVTGFLLLRPYLSISLIALISNLSSFVQVAYPDVFSGPFINEIITSETWLELEKILGWCNNNIGNVLIVSFTIYLVILIGRSLHLYFSTNMAKLFKR